MGCLQFCVCWIGSVKADRGDFFLISCLEMLIMFVLCLKGSGSVNFETAVAFLVTNDVDRLHFPVLNIIDLYFREPEVPHVWDLIGVYITKSYVCGFRVGVLVVEMNHQTVETVSIFVDFRE